MRTSMNTCFETYSASQMFGAAADRFADLREAIQVLRNSLDNPTTRGEAIALMDKLSESGEVFCRDAELAYGETGLNGGVSSGPPAWH